MDNTLNNQKKPKYGTFEYRRWYYLNNKERYKKHSDKWAATHPEKRKEISRNQAYERKMKIFMHYSNGMMMCACCGESHIDFLSLDHMDNDGPAHRKKIGGTGTIVYLWLIKNNFPSGYQILCMNCNFARGKKNNNGTCPHETERQQRIEEIKKSVNLI